MFSIAKDHNSIDFTGLQKRRFNKILPRSASNNCNFNAIINVEIQIIIRIIIFVAAPVEQWFDNYVKFKYISSSNTN